jgi:uncharacterized CHY-type Zn-finger protein
LSVVKNTKDRPIPVPNSQTVHGLDVDYQNRCEHSDSPRDVVAVRFRCCKTYYACRLCHEALADHAASSLSEADAEELAVLCGICRTELSICTSMESQKGVRDAALPSASISYD